jgi:hypothetical protein
MAPGTQDLLTIAIYLTCVTPSALGRPKAKD